MEAPIWRKDNPCSFYFDARGAYAFAPRSNGLWLYVNPRHQEAAKKLTGGEHPKTCQRPCFQNDKHCKNPYETLSSLSGHLAPT